MKFLRGISCGFALLLLCVSVARGGESAIRITDDGLFKQRPVWSPDGKWLCFARHRGSTIFLFLKSADGKTEKRLTKGAGPEFDGSFSPDGKKLAFVFDKISPGQGDLEVYTIGLDGNDQRPVAVSQVLSHEESPAWSPVGDLIAFSSTRDGNQELYTIRSDGKEMKRLTNDPAIDAHPSWSPDGKRIAFSTNRWGDLELAVLHVGTGKLTRLTESPGLDDYPSWSPDGSRIAFTSNRSRNFDIFVVDADGGNPRNVTNHRALDNFPAWTPDGRLTFVSNRGGGFDIYLLQSEKQPGDGSGD